MKRLTSTQALGAGFAAILGLLVYSAVEAFQLQRAGSEQQRLAYRRFIELDDTVTSARRTIWLGGIYARDYFLDRGPAGQAIYSERLNELQRSTSEEVRRLQAASPVRLRDLGIEAGFQAFLLELRQLEGAGGEGIGPPPVFIDRVVIPRRSALLAAMEDFRSSVRRDLVDAQARFDRERAVAARTLVLLLGAALFFGIVVALVSLRYAGRVERERRLHYGAIALANQELENLSVRVLEIQEQERRMLSRELHDEVGQTLTALRMEISQAIGQVGDQPVRERLLRARALAERTVQMVRDISLMLRPPLLDDLGLGPALQWQLEQFSSRSGIAYVCEGADVGEHLPDDVKTCVFRIAQEALNNCEKYAGAASVHVVLRHEAGHVSLAVSDDGCGFSLDSRGLPDCGTGILGMKERAQKLGGSLDVDSQPGTGSRVTLILPVANVDSVEAEILEVSR